jgi:ureidoacrylate peracid hydrolase
MTEEGTAVTKPFAEHRVVRETFDFDPSSTAILIVDMLNDFLEDGGSMVLASGRSTYEPTQRLLDAARAAGSTVIWVCDVHPPQGDKTFEKRGLHCIQGTWGAQIVDALDPRDDEYRVYKRRFSGFFETDLDLRLRELGIKHTIVTGVVTNICVRSTVHDAFFRGYDVIVPEECVSGTTQREHESSLWDIETHFGSVVKLDQVLEILDRSPQHATA